MLASFAPWIVAALGIVAAALLFVRLRSVRAALQEADAQAEELTGRLREVGKRSSSRSAADRRRDDELSELRRKLEKAKKRAIQAREEQLAESHRIKQLDEKLRRRGVEAAATIGRPPVAPAKTAPEKPIASRVEPPVPVTPAPPAAPATVVLPPAAESPPKAESEAENAATRRAEKAEADRDLARGKIRELEVQLKRQQAKAKTQDKLYSSIRLELEAKKDRLGTQQEELERLRALRVALMDGPEAVPATTPEATIGAPDAPS